MESNMAKLMEGLSDEQVAEYQSNKYPPSVQSWARQERDARIVRRSQAQEALASQIAEEVARVARQTTIAKIVKGLEKAWTDDVVNILITKEEVEDLEHGEEVEVKVDLDQSPVKETRYPKIRALVTRFNVHWTEANAKPDKPAKPDKKADNTHSVVIKFLRDDKMVIVGSYASGESAKSDIKAIHHKIFFPHTIYADSEADSAPRNISRNGYYVFNTDGTLKYAPKS